MSVLLNASTSSGLILQSDTSGQIQLQTNGTPTLTVGTSGNLTFNTSNAGIVFSNSSAITNSTLNDYETGTWTPNQGSGLTVVGTFSSGGTYVKVGQVVTVFGRVSGSTSVACSTAGILTSNLPFTVSSTGNTYCVGSMTNGSSTVYNTCFGITTSVYLNGSSIAATFDIYFTMTYRAIF